MKKFHLAEAARKQGITHEAFIREAERFFDNCGAVLGVKNKDYSPEGIAYKELIETARAGRGRDCRRLPTPTA